MIWRKEKHSGMACFRCNGPMAFVINLRKAGNAPDMQTYRCIPCGVIKTSETGEFVPVEKPKSRFLDWRMFKFARFVYRVTR